MATRLGAATHDRARARGEARWPMAMAVVATGLLRASLPSELRNGDARWLFLAVMVALLAVLIIGDPGRIDRDLPWLRILTNCLIGVITLANADAAIRLVVSIINTSPFTDNAKVLLARWRRDLAHERDRLRSLVLGAGPRGSGRPRW